VSRRDRIRQTKIQHEAEGYLELGLPENALRALARLGEPGELDPHALYLRGEALRMLKRYNEAIPALQQVGMAMAKNIHVWIALGWCYKRIDRIDRAIEALETALTAEPEEPLVLYNLACYWSLAGDKSQALEYLSRALSIDVAYRELIEDEPDFDPIRDDPGFQAISSGAQPAG